MKRCHQRSSSPHRLWIEPLEPRQFLSATHIVPGVISPGPRVISQTTTDLVQGSAADTKALLGTITNDLSGTVKTTALYVTLNVAYAWDDGTISYGTVAVHPGGGVSILATDGQPAQLFDLYVAGGNHTVGGHAVYVAFWQWDGNAHPKLLSSFSFRTIVGITQNSTNGQTITGQAGQTFTGSVGTLPADILPASLTSPQSSPITTDPGQADNAAVRVLIQWGDGTSSDATLVKNNDGTWDIQGTHTYADAGTYRATITATYRQIGTPGSFVPQIIVTLYDADDTAIISPTPPAVQVTQNAPSPFTATLGDIHLPPGVSAQSVQLTIAWGDGKTSQAKLVANNSGGYDIIGTHIYAMPGTFSIQITGIVQSSDNPVDIFQTATVAGPSINPLFPSS